MSKGILKTARLVKQESRKFEVSCGVLSHS